jgi:uncharacterized repeat protein (TIGR01451 family)
VDGAHDLALDSGGQPHVGFTLYNTSGLYYASLQAGSWITQTVEPISHSTGVRDPVLVLSADQPRLAYIYVASQGLGWTDFYLKYAAWNGSAWDLEVVDQVVGLYLTGSMANVGLALDPSGFPHISYDRCDESGCALQYASGTGSAWITETVTMGHSIYDSSLALDAQGLARITYLDLNDGDLHIATQTLPPLMLAKRASPVEGLHAGDVVTFTLELGSAGLDVTFRDPLPSGLAFVPGSLTGTVSPVPTYDAGQGAVLWQGTLLAGPQVITFQTTLDTARSLVNTAWLTDTANLRTVSAAVILNPERVYLPLIRK